MSDTAYTYETVGERLAPMLSPLVDLIEEGTIIDKSDPDVVDRLNTALNTLRHSADSVEEIETNLSSELLETKTNSAVAKVAEITTNVTATRRVVIVDKDGKFTTKTLKPEPAQELANTIKQDTGAGGFEVVSSGKAIDEVCGDLAELVMQAANDMKPLRLSDRLKSGFTRYLGAPTERELVDRHKLRHSNAQAVRVSDAKEQAKRITKKLRSMAEDPRRAIRLTRAWAEENSVHKSEAEALASLDAIRIATDYLEGRKGVFATPTKQAREKTSRGGGTATANVTHEKSELIPDNVDTPYVPVEFDDKRNFHHEFELPWIDSTNLVELTTSQAVLGDQFQVLIFNGMDVRRQKIADKLSAEGTKSNLLDQIIEEQAKAIASGIDPRRHGGLKRTSVGGDYSDETIWRNTHRRNNAPRVYFVLKPINGHKNTYAMIIVAKADKNNEDTVIAELSGTNLSTARARGAGAV